MRRVSRTILACCVAACLAVLAAGSEAAAASRSRSSSAPVVDLKTQVEADWAAQEERLGRAAGSAESIRAALRRGRLLLDDLRSRADAPDLAADAAALDRLQAEAAKADALDEAARLALYRRLRSQTRETALKNPLLAGRSVAFMKRRRFTHRTLHEYVAFFADCSGQFGGGIAVLEEPGKSLKTRDLIGRRLAPGCYCTLALSYDAKTLYFGYGECVGRPMPWGDIRQAYNHLLAVDVDGGEIRQLTQGRYDDFNPCPLPDGGLAFLSTRPGAFARSNAPDDPAPVYTLHRVGADGEGLRPLSFHEANEWHPSVLHDGRIVYSRWDFVDRSAAHFHGLWATNPDGTNPVALVGNYSGRINAFYQPHAVPGSDRIVFVAGGHHVDVGGALALFDPARARLDAAGGDALDSIEILTPEVALPESTEKDGAGRPTGYYHSPWPLSENYYLVAFGYGPVPGEATGVRRDSTGIYYFDRFGNLELLYRDGRMACMYPVLIAPRPVPPVVAGTREPALGDEGEFVVEDVRRSLLALPAARPVRSLRIFQVLPKTTPESNEPRIGHANAEAARMLLGTVPVEADGSAYFRAPAGAPLYFQAVDADGRAVQSMRSITYLQPGERRGCVGCHEPTGAAPSGRASMALARPASTIEPGPEGSRPFSYARLVQPVLDRHCVRCHDGTTGTDKSPLVLTGAAEGTFSRSYNALKPFVRWHEWGEASLSGAVTQPGRLGADSSRLTQILSDATHAAKSPLPAEDRLRIMVWLDGNVPFRGEYEQVQSGK